MTAIKKIPRTIKAKRINAVVKYMIDSNTLIHIANKATGYRNIVKRLQACEKGEVVLSAIVAHELHFGLEQQRLGKARKDDLADLMKPYKVISFNTKAAEVAAQVSVFLDGKGSKLGPYDVLHAGHAKSVGLVCVTDNVGEYSRVP